MSDKKIIPFGLIPGKDESKVTSHLMATYRQNPDDCDDLGDLQELTIETQDGGAGVYYVIETERWAFDDIDDLISVLEDFKKKIGDQV